MSSDSGPRDFDDDFSWSQKMQRRYAVDLYKQYPPWDGCEVVEVDTMGKEEDVARVLDFGDVDKIIRVKKKGLNVHLAQRFRRAPDNPAYDQDFSLRCDREGSDHVIEFDRLLNAYRDGLSSYPPRYAFGVGEENGLQNGFAEFYILRTDPILKAIDERTINITPSLDDDPQYIPGGTKARFIKVEELKRIGAVEGEWQPRCGSTGQTSLTDHAGRWDILLGSGADA